MKLSYICRGQGRDLLLLHGYLSSKESFIGQINYFSKHYRVTAPDFPGMGAAEPLTEPWSVGDYADWTQEMMAQLKIEEPLLIAHSFGGRVAVKLLARGQADRAVLTGCAGIRRRTFSYHMKVAAYRLVRNFAPRYAEAHFGSAEYRTLSPVMKESYKKIVNEDLREEAKEIARPVLFLHGERDKTVPLSSIGIYLSCIRGSRLKVLKECGHFAFLDDPLAFDLAAEEFLQC